MRHRALLILVIFGSTAIGQAPVRDLIVEKVERSVAFYERLGFTQPADAPSVTLTRGATVLRVARGKPTIAARDDAILITVDSLTACESELRRARAEIDAKPGPGRSRSLHLTDPDGYRVVFRTHEDARRPPLPRSGELNPYVLEVLARYPTDGTHPYYWPKSGGWRGSTKDLTYAEGMVSEGDPEGRAYCCGLTFEVFLDAWKLWCRRNGWSERIAGLDLAGVRKLQGQWFGSAADRTCIRTALLDNRLGTRIDELREARPGDFVQLWRHSGSGHSVIFLEWEKKNGRIVGMTYWSTQGSTKGIGRRTERFGSSGSAMKADELYVCRVGLDR